jgi:hypothetical protein
LGLAGLLLSPYHNRLSDRSMAIQDFFNLRRLDAVATDLDSKILASFVDQASVGKLKAQIATEIDSLITARWIGFEFIFSKFGSMPITGRKIAASNGDLAYFVNTNLFPRIIQQKTFLILNRITYRNFLTEEFCPETDRVKAYQSGFGTG